MQPSRGSPMPFWAGSRARRPCSQGYRDEAEDWLIANRAPEKALRIIKSAMGAGSTTDSDLGDYGISIGAWSDSMRTKSAFYRILDDGGFFRLPVQTRVGITTTLPSGSVVARGCRGAAVTAPVAERDARPDEGERADGRHRRAVARCSAAGQTALNRALMGAVATPSIARLSICYVVPARSTPASGTTAVDAKADLRAALMAVNSVGTAKLYWIAAPDVAKMASTLNSTGLDAFPAMSATGGEMANLPAIVSSGVAGGSLVPGRCLGIAADGGPVTVNASRASRDPDGHRAGHERRHADPGAR